MKHKDMLDYQNYLKKVYLNSKIQDCYRSHIQNLFQNEVLSSAIYDELLTKGDYGEKPVVVLGGFYPKHLRYSPNLISRFIYTTTVMEMEFMPRKLIKKELLRKIYLFVFEDFLKDCPFGIDFTAKYRIPINSIAFTAAYQNSGAKIKDFFDKQ